MQVSKDFTYTHPLLKEIHFRIQEEVIKKHNAPFRLFETSRDFERHQMLLTKGRTMNVLSRHLYNMEYEQPLYCTAMDYVFYNGKWSWNLRDQTIVSWYILFGNLVLDACPELTWDGNSRKYTNYTHFQLKERVVLESIEKFPCTLHLS